jgi:hypothetical protein
MHPFGVTYSLLEWSAGPASTDLLDETVTAVADVEG